MYVISKITAERPKPEIQKEAMAVYTPPKGTPTAEEMRAHGIYVLKDMIRQLPHSSQEKTMKAIQDVQDSGASEFFKYLTPKTVMSLPKVYILDPDDVYEYKGQKYVTIDVVDGAELKTPGVAGKKYTPPSQKNLPPDQRITYPAGTRIPGEIIALNLSNGEVEFLPLPDLIKNVQVNPKKIDEDLVKFNKEVKEYNDKISSLNGATGANKQYASRLGLQINRADRQIDMRIADLNRMIVANQKNLEQIKRLVPIQKTWDKEMMDAVSGGQLSIRDAFETVLYHYQSIPEQLITDLTSTPPAITVPEELKSGLIAIAQKEIESRTEYENQKKIQQDKIQEIKNKQEIPQIHESPIDQLTRADIPSGKQQYNKIRQPLSVHHEVASIERKIEGSKENIRKLMEIKDAIAKMQQYLTDLTALESKMMAKEVLNTAEGKPILDVLKHFLVEVTNFIKNYDVNTNIVQDNKINSKLFGSKGTLGNALLATALMRLFNVVKETIETYTGGEQQSGGVPAVKDRDPFDFSGKVRKPRPLPPQDPFDFSHKVRTKTPAPVASVQDKIKRMSELLWMPFADRMRLK